MSDDDDVVDGLENVVSAVGRVERAVKDKRSTAQVDASRLRAVFQPTRFVRKWLFSTAQSRCPTEQYK
jgi:hypothetical protein